MFSSKPTFVIKGNKKSQKIADNLKQIYKLWLLLWLWCTVNIINFFGIGCVRLRVSHILDFSDELPASVETNVSSYLLCRLLKYFCPVFSYLWWLVDFTYFWSSPLILPICNAVISIWFETFSEFHFQWLLNVCDVLLQYSVFSSIFSNPSPMFFSPLPCGQFQFLKNNFSFSFPLIVLIFQLFLCVDLDNAVLLIWLLNLWVDFFFPVGCWQVTLIYWTLLLKISSFPSVFSNLCDTFPSNCFKVSIDCWTVLPDLL